MRVTVLGGGNGAFATSGHLALAGHSVTLCESPEFAESIAPLRSDPVIEVQADSYTSLPLGNARLAEVTTDFAEALSLADLVIVAMPSYGHGTVARRIARHVKPGQAILVVPGNLWGAVEFRAALREAGTEEGVLVGEAACLIYACRKTAPQRIWIRGCKHGLSVSAFPAKDTPALVEIVRRLYPDVVPGNTVIETGLSNVNPFFHPPIFLANAARIEMDPQEFRFYVEGSSPGVSRLIEAMDAERLAIARAVGIQLDSLAAMTLRWYERDGAAGRTIYDLHHTVPAYLSSKSPNGLDSRYLQEDLPYGLAPVSELGREVGVPTPTIDSVVTVLSAFTGQEVVAARSMASFGLSGIPPGELIKAL